MATRKTKPIKATKLYSAGKTLNVIDALGWDSEKFKKAYDDPESVGLKQRVRGLPKLSDEAVKAIKAYINNNNPKTFAAVMDAMGTKSRNTTINRILKFQEADAA